MTSSHVTASSSLDALAAAADAAARAALRTLTIPGRQRHCRRAQKARPKFPHATAASVRCGGADLGRQLSVSSRGVPLTTAG
jgi:Flp pilus assembly protein TadG